MGDGGQAVLSPAHLGIAYHIFAVDGVQTQLRRYLKAQFQGLCRAGAEGHARPGLGPDAVHGHQAADVPYHIFPVLPGKALYVIHCLLVHSSSFLRFLCRR